jgi:predicted amidohydrolase
MTASYLAAAVQMESGPDKATNLTAAHRLVEKAASAGAQLVALPELFSCLGSYELVAGAAEPIPGPTSDALSALAAQAGVTLVAGSIAERQSPGENSTRSESSASADRVFNTSLLFDPEGRLLARYRKLHRFDVDLPGSVTVRESEWFAAGDDVAPVTTPLGTIGTAICYDLRFPELFRRLSRAGAEVIVLPSAFSAVTGREHWEVLLRARAIENQCYVIAPNQCGHAPGAFAMHGHSVIFDPWGSIVSIAGAANGQVASKTIGETIVYGTIDLARLEKIRAQLPALQHRRD